MFLGNVQDGLTDNNRIDNLCSAYYGKDSIYNPYFQKIYRNVPYISFQLECCNADSARRKVAIIGTIKIPQKKLLIP